ncbi:unnamed protein product [Mytilus edulis]|uniref:Reverse transcriptase domain-containing protein n=1 Tax=Mytilus edulis TaxID=6550 RepID=A0A8S3U359_MYTED|nr:unnamed protein product [Mytilus edulis]
MPHPLVFSSEENEYVQKEIDKFISKTIIQPVTPIEDQYVSNIFVRPKKDGTYRVILNLKQLNLDIEQIHFKMETFKTAITNITQNCWFGSVDLKDAYYSVSINEKDRKYLRFYWNEVLYEYTCLPNGLTTAPRIFTKILKVVFSKLRSKGHCNTPYIDDSLLVSKTFSGCQSNIIDTVQLLDHLGFTIHPDKSVLQPTQIIVFLGFVINSITMCIRVTKEKADNIIKLCSRLILKEEITIREFAQVIGKLVATEPGVQYAPLYIKSLEITKDLLLKQNYGNFDAKMTLSDGNISDLNWWVNNINSSFKPMTLIDPQFILNTDSSNTGWGAVVQDTLFETKGFWSYEEQKNHINFLELKAAYLALIWFCSSRNNVHVKVYLDNMVAVNYINKMGGRIVKLNNLTKELWIWCIQRKIWVTACHLPGVANIEADRLSRSINVDIEWKLHDDVFNIIDCLFGPHDVDLFAFKFNRQLPRYLSYLPDTYAVAVDAFSVKWSNINCYCFSPFSLIGKILQKVDQDQADMTLVAPLWNTQNWFPQILHRIVAQSFIINNRKKSSVSTPESNKGASFSEIAISSFQDIGEILQNYGLSKESSEIIIASWKPATRQQYWTYFKRWLLFCSERKINSFKATELNVLEFLTSLYEIGLGYSAINTARSMLSSFMSVNQEKTVGQWPLVKRFLKGIFNLKPSLPRYQRTWDVEVVLKYLKTLSPVYMLSLRVLTYKLVTLLLLLTGQRLQTIHSLDLDDITVTDSNIYIDVRSLLKCSKPGRHLQPIELPAFIEDKSLCIVTVLKEYLVRTSCFRKTQKLILSCIKPYSHVSKDTLGRWVKIVLQTAGVDITIYKPHSTRSASTSAALRCATSIDTILKAAGWSNESTFRKFYDKPVSKQNYNDNYSVKVLRSHMLSNSDKSHV